MKVTRGCCCRNQTIYVLVACQPFCNLWASSTTWKISTWPATWEGGAPTLTTTAPVIYTILASDNNADYITSAQVEKSRPIRVDRWTSLGREGNWPPRLSYRRRTDVSNRRPIDSLQPDTPKFDKKALLNQRSGGCWNQWQASISLIRIVVRESQRE